MTTRHSQAALRSAYRQGVTSHDTFPLLPPHQLQGLTRTLQRLQVGKLGNVHPQRLHQSRQGRGGGEAESEGLIVVDNIDSGAERSASEADNGARRQYGIPPQVTISAIQPRPVVATLLSGRFRTMVIGMADPGITATQLSILSVPKQ